MLQFTQDTLQNCILSSNIDSIFVCRIWQADRLQKREEQTNENYQSNQPNRTL